MNAFITAILVLKKKQVKKYISKLKVFSSYHTSSLFIKDDDEKIKDEIQVSFIQYNALVDILKCIFIIIYITKFNKKKFVFDIKIIYFTEFKIHDYNTIIIKIIYKKIKKTKINFKQKFVIIIIFELKLKKCLKIIFNSLN